jgi:uncharacterized protein (DUF1501 family)
VATVGAPGLSAPPLVASLRGPVEFAPMKNSDGIDMKEYAAELNKETEQHSSFFGETWSVHFQRAVEDSEELVSAVSRVNLTQAYPSDEPGQAYIKKIKTLSNLILTQADRGYDRDVLFVELGSFDHHADMKYKHKTEFAGLNKALSIFEKEMKAQGLWDQVTIVAVSDFARTLTANSREGSDHAWGGNYFMFGGTVAGGKIHGQYPPDITINGPLNVGHGRIIPTSSWEFMFTGPLQRMGLDTDVDLDYCMPNRIYAGAPLFTADQVFTTQEGQTDGTRALR